MYLLAAQWACSGGDPDPSHPNPDPDTTDSGSTPTGPAITAGPVVGLPTSPDVQLVRILTVSTAVPTRLTVIVDDGDVRREIAFPDLATDHRRPLLGLRADHAFTAEITLTDEAGTAARPPAVPFSTGPLSLPVPTFEILKREASAVPGYTLMPVSTDLTAVIVALDLDGEPVWGFDPQGKPWALSQAASGDIGLLRFGGLYRLSVEGDWLVAYNGPVDAPYSIPVAVDGFNHEATQLPDGSFVSLHNEPFDVPSYPFEDLTGAEPARISDDQVYEIDPSGAVAHQWSMAAMLDPTRIGYGSHEGNPYDWGHANAVAYDALDDAMVVSLRHQDAVVKFDRSTGAIRWILANHDGWTATHAPYLLEPVGTPFAWPYHQHAPMVHPNDSGLVVMFDNGNDHRTTPYSAAPEPGLYSRVVAYRIDEAAHTIHQEWEFREGEGVDLLYTQALGNADFIVPDVAGDPAASHVLATFPYLRNEDGVFNTDIGRGDKSIRVIEIDPVSGQSVWDLRMYGDFASHPEGWQADRVIRVPSLYGATATERIVD